MDKRLQEMLDHFEISKTLKQYARGCDRCDEPRMAGVYLEDSWDDHGRLQAPGAEFSRIMIGDILTTTETLSHLLGQSSITVDGDTAGAETYFIAGMQNRREDGTKVCNLLGGRYVDRLERDGDRWRIKHRIVLRDWSSSVPVEKDWTDHAQLRAGYRSGEDVSFEVLGEIHGGNQSAERETA